MFEDVKKMIAVRKRESGILAVRPEINRPKLMAVPFQSQSSVPRPYVRWNNGGAIIVAANRGTEEDANLQLQLPLQQIGLAGRNHYTVRNLWPGGESVTLTEKDLSVLPCTVRRDKTPGGGLRVLKIETGLRLGCGIRLARQGETLSNPNQIGPPATRTHLRSEA
jgi:hypothetical protein